MADSISSRSDDTGETYRQARRKALVAAVARVEARLKPSPVGRGHGVLVMLCGVPGSGKSYLARRLRPHLEATIIETDNVRHLLFRSPCYSGTENAWVYAVCHTLIERCLRRGQAVIFDATNLIERSRRQVYEIAERSGAPLVIVHVTAPDAEIRRRLQARHAQDDPDDHSDADIAVYDKLRLTEQPIRRPHLVVDTIQDIEESVRRILAACGAHICGDNDKDMESTPYVVLEHTADLALRVWGKSLSELLENAAVGMFAQMAALDQVPLTVQRQVNVSADDDEALLVAWLSELLYLRDVNGEAYCRFQVHLPTPGHLKADIEGGPYRAWERPVKAVTYHGLHIERRADRYEATIIFDV